MEGAKIIQLNSILFYSLNKFYIFIPITSFGMDEKEMSVEESF